MQTIWLDLRFDELHILDGQKLVNILYGPKERQPIIDKLSPADRERLNRGEELDNPLPQ